MIQQSFNSILGALYQGMAVSEHLKQQKPIASAAEKELEEYKKAEEREQRDYELGREELASRGYTPSEIESRAGDIYEMRNELGYLYGMDALSRRIEARTFDPAEATVAEMDFLKLLREKPGQAAQHLAADYIAQDNAMRSNQEQRNRATQNKKKKKGGQAQ